MPRYRVESTGYLDALNNATPAEGQTWDDVSERTQIFITFWEFAHKTGLFTTDFSKEELQTVLREWPDFAQQRGLDLDHGWDLLAKFETPLILGFAGGMGGPLTFAYIKKIAEMNRQPAEEKVDSEETEKTE